MFYGIANFYLERKINKIIVNVRNILNKDLIDQQANFIKVKEDSDRVAQITLNESKKIIEEHINTIKKRLLVEQEYLILRKHYKKDPKRKYMVNKNYYFYLQALEYVYNTSNSAILAGVNTAPKRIYEVIYKVEASFETLLIGLSINKNN